MFRLLKRFLSKKVASNPAGSSRTSNKTSLAESQTGSRPIDSLPISIHPNPDYYIETQSSPYIRVRRVIDVSDGGVIGITGERGAGKSVLLNKLIDTYSQEFLTVNLSAPVSSSREMEFFLMLFRHLTQRVIAELRRRVRRSADDIDSIGKAVIRREQRRFFLTNIAITVIIIMATVSYFGWRTHAGRIAELQRELAAFSSGNTQIDRERAISSSYVDEVQSKIIESLNDFGTPAQKRYSEHLNLPVLMNQFAPSDFPIMRQWLTEVQAEIKEKQSDTTSRIRLKKLRSQQERIESALTQIDQIVAERKQHVNDKLTSLQKVSWPWLNYDYMTLIVAAGSLTAIGIMVVIFFSRLLRKTRGGPSAVGLLVYSERLSRKLDYELTRSAEWGAELTPLQWFKASAKRSSEEKARGLSLPELTASYIEFVSNVLRVFPGKLLICIDELDKVTDLDQVRFIFREIKGALYVKGTFYVLSISNDALRSFEGRLGDQRDIFESTFDDVFSVRPLDIESSMRILSNRLEGARTSANQPMLADRVLVIISVFSAGNARDLIRGFRECVISGANSAMDAEVAWSLLFSRRLESILDRVVAIQAFDEARSKLLALVEKPVLFRQFAIEVSDIRAFRAYLRESVTDRALQADEKTMFQRLMRYSTELEILLFARERIVKPDFSEQVVKDASTIMKAYQVLPLSYGDAQQILASITTGVSFEENVNVRLASMESSLQQPVSDREVTAIRRRPE